MKCTLVLCADGIVVDRQTNGVSVFNIIEELSSPGFPVFIPKIFFFTLLEKSKTSDADPSGLKIEVKNNDEQLLEMPIKATFQGKLRNRQIVQLGGLAIPSPGNLVFRLLDGKGKTICENILPVNKVGGPTAKPIPGKQIKNRSKNSH